MLKKSTFLLAVTTLAATVVFSPVQATANSDYVKEVHLTIGQTTAQVNENNVPLDQAPYVKNGRTLVPFRFLGEALGAEVTWDSNNKSANLKLKDLDVKVPIGSTTAYINGQATTLDVPAESTGGRTFVPLRFVSEALGAEVGYDATDKEISVYSIDTTGWNQFNDPIEGNLIYPQDWTLTGDLNTTLKLSSPWNSMVTVEIKQGSLEKVVADQKTNFLGNGYKLLIESPLNEAKKAEGTVLSFIKPSDTAAPAVICLVVNKGEKQELYTLLSPIDKIELDSNMLDKIFISEADFAKWAEAQK